MNTYSPARVIIGKLIVERPCSRFTIDDSRTHFFNPCILYPGNHGLVSTFEVENSAMAYKNKEVYNPYTGQSIRFLQTSCDTDGELLEMETAYQPHSKEPPPHYHPMQEETFRVLEGTISVRINGITYTLEKGDHLVVPPRTVHSMWNSSNDTAVVNWQVRPALNTEHLLEMGMGLASDGRVGPNGMPSFLQSAVLLRSYSRVYRLAKPSPLVQKMIFGLLAPIGRLAGYRPVHEKYVDTEPESRPGRCR